MGTPDNKTAYSDADLAELTDEEREGLLEDDGSGAEDDDDDEIEGKPADFGKPEDPPAGDGGKREDDAAARAAADAAAAAAAEAAAEAARQAAAPPVQQPAKLNLPPDIDNRIKALEAKQDELDKKVDEGEITLAEHRAQGRELDKELGELQDRRRAVEFDAERERNTWFTSTVTGFLAGHEQYKEGEPMHAALNQEVRRLQAEKVQAGGSQYDPAILKAAHENLEAKIRAQFGIAAKTPAPGAGQKTPKPEIPPTLGGVPSAEPNDDTGEFAWLDRLADSDFEKYERELGKMSEEQRNRYLEA